MFEIYGWFLVSSLPFTWYEPSEEHPEEDHDYAKSRAFIEAALDRAFVAKPKRLFTGGDAVQVIFGLTAPRERGYVTSMRTLAAEVAAFGVGSYGMIHMRGDQDPERPAYGEFLVLSVAGGGVRETRDELIGPFQPSFSDGDETAETPGR